MTACKISNKISNAILLALASFALCAAAPARAEPQVPRLDVTPTCRPMEKNNALQLDEKRCRESENAAREQLVREWGNFPAADRTECTTAATMGGTASYVELITCLEMKRHVTELSKRSAEESTPPAGGRRKR